jgi:hypothetical protein
MTTNRAYCHFFKELAIIISKMQLRDFQTSISRPKKRLMTISRAYCHFFKELTIIISKTQLRISRCQFSEAGRCRVQNCKNLLSSLFSGATQNVLRFPSPDPARGSQEPPMIRTATVRARLLLSRSYVAQVRHAQLRMRGFLRSPCKYISKHLPCTADAPLFLMAVQAQAASRWPLVRWKASHLGSVRYILVLPAAF